MGFGFGEVTRAIAARLIDLWIFGQEEHSASSRGKITCAWAPEGQDFGPARGPGLHVPGGRRQ
jgi:hypothetical protein